MSDSESSQTVEAPVAERRTAWRSVAAVVCVVLAALLTTPAAVAFWGQRTLNDGQRYLDTGSVASGRNGQGLGPAEALFRPQARVR
jgi:hypothetical protein